MIQLTIERDYPNRASVLWKSPEEVAFLVAASHVEEGGLHGAEWTIDGVKAGGYHVVSRWSPERSP